MIKMKKILNWETSIKKGFAKPLVLKLLNENESFPYQLTKGIFNVTNGEIMIATSNIYPMLKELKNKGFVSSKIDETEKREIYNITLDGKDVLKQITMFINSFLINIGKSFVLKEDLK
ncbi:MAG: hypothetical protein HeimC3_43610 [Candidatus Heimdallarchaeota archaeon LC_3]|nr:MAG: hypothetical protein HeimC3_43610 [Candidatus Heimdallarchaeota archaeon LC_3]